MSPLVNYALASGYSLVLAKSGPRHFTSNWQVLPDDQSSTPLYYVFHASPTCKKGQSFDHPDCTHCFDVIDPFLQTPLPIFPNPSLLHQKTLKLSNVQVCQITESSNQFIHLLEYFLLSIIHFLRNAK